MLTVQECKMVLYGLHGLLAKAVTLAGRLPAQAIHHHVQEESHVHGERLASLNLHGWLEPVEHAVTVTAANQRACRPRGHDVVEMLDAVLNGHVPVGIE